MFGIALFLLFPIVLTIEESKYVQDLDDKNFYDVLRSQETALVMFYAPWCGHCKKLKPEYVHGAKRSRKEGLPVGFYRIDCTDVGKDVCERNDIEAYPTLKIFTRGVFSSEYEGPRDAVGIMKHFEQLLGPSSLEINTNEELELFLVSNTFNVSVVAFVEKSSELGKVFKQVADEMRSRVKFAHTSAPEVLEKQNIKDGIVLFRPPYLRSKFETEKVEFHGEYTTEAITNYIKRHYHGIVGHRTVHNENDFTKYPLVIAYYDMDFVRNPGGASYWRNRILKVAQNYKDRLNFVVCSTSEFHYELNEMEILFALETKPMVVVRNANKQKFVMREPFSIETMIAFLDKFLAGSLNPDVKSLPVLENDKGPVYEVVASNFEQLVKRNRKDTVLAFYAPWSPRCRDLERLYKKLATLMKDEDIYFAKMDATRNDVPPNYNITDYPQIYWLSKKNKENPIQYQGVFEMDIMIKYIAANATEELKGYERNGEKKLFDYERDEEEKPEKDEL